MDPNPIDEHIDAVVDYLLRDQDYLLAKELKHRIEELNQLLVQANAQKMKVDFTVSESTAESGGRIAHVDIAVYKQI